MLIRFVKNHGPAVALWLIAAAWAIGWGMSATPAAMAAKDDAAPADQTRAASARTPAEEARALWQAISADLPTLLEDSRPILVGKRRIVPHDPRWHNNRSVGFPQDLADADGGPGLRLVYLLKNPPARSRPSQDFAWYQGKPRAMMEDMRDQNRLVLPRAVLLARQTERLAELVRQWDAAPKWPVRPAAKPTWPGYCYDSLAIAIARGDLALCRQFADELAAASFALADQHRWLDFLLGNTLTALDFQARCKSQILACDALYKDRGGYDADNDIGGFPGSMALGHGLMNCLEVDRQADGLFQVPEDYIEMTLDGDSRVRSEGLEVTRAALWIPPDLRESFVQLRANLSPANRAAWDEAAHRPFDRSFLVNMLFRTRETGAAAPLGTVLKRFDALNPHASAAQLMGVIFYRAGDFTGGYAWDDRFDRRLLATSADLGPDNEAALLKAHAFAQRLFGTWDHYGPVDSLRDALDTHRLNCLRATDLIGALYRDSGRAGFYNLRLSSGTVGHTVAAVRVDAGGQTRMVAADGLDLDQKAPELWPQDYLGGYCWPAGKFEKEPPPFAAELHVRGLNSYVWVEGYVLRGDNKGAFLQTKIPYLPELPRPDLAMGK